MINKINNPIIKGTFILTLFSIFSKVSGFFYKIYLSNYIGSVNLGLYQLIFPVFTLCATIYGASIQSSISALCASSKHNRHNIMFTGCLISLFLSSLLSVILYLHSDNIALFLLHEGKCSAALKVLSLLFPFCGLSSCICGYCYSINNTFIPSVSQLIEQLSRIIFIIVIYNTKSYGPSVIIAVSALVIGEFISFIFCLIAFCFTGFSIKKLCVKDLYNDSLELISFTIPLTMHRLIINLFCSIEAVMIPAFLVKNGYTINDALSTYGILTGMSFSIVLFPSAITNSLSVILLPVISKAHSDNSVIKLQKTVTNVVHYCLVIGIGCIGIFIFFGKYMGLLLFNNIDAGIYIKILSWLCPFIYLSTSLTSILNGLNKIKNAFISSIIGIVIRILFILFFVPLYGIYGYLIGFLVSAIVTALINIYYVYREIHFTFDTVSSILYPSICITIISFMSKCIYQYLNISYIKPTILLFMVSIFSIVLYSICILLKGRN